MTSTSQYGMASCYYLNMRTTALLCLLLCACGGETGDPSDWDATVDDFVAAACVEGEACTGDDPVACEDDVRTDLDDARAELDEAGEDQCMACLEVKAAQFRAIIAAACDEDAADEAAVFAACDLDPTVDYDGDGSVDNDDDEACAGFP